MEIKSEIIVQLSLIKNCGAGKVQKERHLSLHSDKTDDDEHQDRNWLDSNRSYPWSWLYDYVLLDYHKVPTSPGLRRYG